MSQDAAASSSEPPPPGQAFSSSKMPLLRQRSATAGTERRSLDLPRLGLTETNDSSGGGSNFGSASSERQGSTMHNDPHDTAQRNKLQSSADIDRQWVEMQNTLSEVELSGATGGASVFSSGHALALEELRKAQIALAQAWARSETDDVDAEGDITTDRHDTQRANEAGVSARLLAEDRKEQLNGKAKTGKGGSSGTGKSRLEEETENDIELARKRRAANDRYFEKVNKGVVDVVEKLEAVANKMRGVEMESKEIWGSEDTVDDGSSM